MNLTLELGEKIAYTVLRMDMGLVVQIVITKFFKYGLTIALFEIILGHCDLPGNGI